MAKLQDVLVGGTMGYASSLLLVPLVNHLDSTLMSTFTGPLLIVAAFYTVSCFYPSATGRILESRRV
jgi:hypothetical protein